MLLSSDDRPLSTQPCHIWPSAERGCFLSRVTQFPKERLFLLHMTQCKERAAQAQTWGFFVLFCFLEKGFIHPIFMIGFPGVRFPVSLPAPLFFGMCIAQSLSLSLLKCLCTQFQETFLKSFHSFFETSILCTTHLVTSTLHLPSNPSYCPLFFSVFPVLFP